MDVVRQQVRTDELLLMPGNGFRYELIKGELRRMNPATSGRADTGGDPGGTPVSGSCSEGVEADYLSFDSVAGICVAEEKARLVAT
jgi:hypothetical protein